MFGRRRPRRGMGPRRMIPRPIVRRIIRRERRRMRRRTRRMMFGSFVLLALAGGYHNHKFHHDDIERIENYYGRPAEDLTEKELLNAMRKLGIKRLELDDDEYTQFEDEDDYY